MEGDKKESQSGLLTKDPSSPAVIVVADTHNEDDSSDGEQSEWPVLIPRIVTDSPMKSYQDLCHDEPEPQGEDVKKKRDLKVALRNWRRKLEPRASWILLFFIILPIHFIIGMDFVSFSIYYVEYSKYFYKDSSSAIALIVALKMAVLAVFGIVTSVMITRYGCRPVSMIGGGTMAFALLISSFAPSVIILYFTQGLLQGVGYSLCTMVTAFLIQKNFSRNRVLGEGIGMLGISFGNMAGPPLVNYLIEEYGWRGTLLLQAAIIANIIPLSIAMGRYDVSQRKNVLKTTSNVDEKAKLNQVKTNIDKKRTKLCHNIRKLFRDIFDFSLFKDVRFLFIALSGLFCKFNIQTFMQHMPSRAVFMGMTTADGATFISACSFSILVCRIAVTGFANIKGVNRVLLFSIGGFIAGIDGFVVGSFKTYTGQLIGSIVNGPHIGLTNTIGTVMLVDLMGLDRLPRAMALFNLTVGVSSITAAPFAGYLFDVTGDYDLPFLVSGGLGILGGICGLVSTVLDIIKRRKEERKLRAAEEATSINKSESNNK